MQTYGISYAAAKVGIFRVIHKRETKVSASNSNYGW